MKKYINFLNIFGFLLLITSCGGSETKSEENEKDAEAPKIEIYSPEYDAIELAEVICVIERLHVEMLEAFEEEKENIMERIKDLGKIADEMNLKIEEKYVGDEEALIVFRETLIKYEC